MGWTVVFVGPPGCGKGTQAARLAKESGALHFDMGSALRAEVAAGGELGEAIAAYSEHGKLVPLPTIRRLVEKFFGDRSRDNVVLDGFPRSLDQVELIESVLPTIGRQMNAVVLFELDEGEAISRIISRRHCPFCGALYNLRSKPPTVDERCDDCATKLVSRKDDTEAVVRERFEVYRRETTPVVEYFRERGLLHTVDASGELEAVTRRIRGIVDIDE